MSLSHLDAAGRARMVDVGSKPETERKAVAEGSISMSREAYELVEKGLIGEADFRDFVCTNPVRFYTALTPDFFQGTRIESEAARVVAAERD